MYLIIADDEKTTRDSLLEFIPWHDLGIDKVETAKNGNSALELCEQMPPDILLTDVRMPKMDGIELATNLRRLYPECKIIFLSGYADKEYLKEAIHLQAVSYIEKPINRTEVISIIKKAVSQCLENIRKKHDTEYLQSKVSESIPLVRQEIVLKLVQNNWEADICTKYEENILHLPKKYNYAAAYVIFNWDSCMEQDNWVRIRKKLLFFLNNLDSQIPASLLYGFDEKGCLIIIWSNNSDTLSSDMRKVHGILTDFISVQTEASFSITIGEGSQVSDLRSLQESFIKAAAAASNQFYLGTGRIHAAQPVDSKKYEADKNLYDDFRDALLKNRSNDAESLIIRLTLAIKSARDSNIGYIRNIYFNLILILYDTAFDKELFHTAGIEQKFIWQEISTMHTLSELSNYVISNMQTFFSFREALDESKKKVIEITNIINDNISNSVLSVQFIAGKCFLSESYLCAFFKKNTGKTLNECITEARIEKAKKLLKDHNMKLYEVTGLIGLSDANYFSTLFKKYVGMTPSEFRERS